MRKQKTTSSELVCSDCGAIFTIARKKGQQREKYHKKTLYCYYCNKVTIHIEVKNLDLLKEELSFKKELTEEERQLKELLIKNRNNKMKQEEKQKILIKEPFKD